jgi:RNA polymerase sigma factor (sigma-70 family)
MSVVRRTGRLKKALAAGVLEAVDESPAAGGTTIAVLAEIYERGYHQYLRVAEAILGDVDLAHDAVQDAFARAIRSRSRYRGTGSVEGWLWRTVVNAAKNARRVSFRAHVPLDEVGDGLRALGTDGSPGELAALVGALPERQRLVLFLRYYADLDYQRIADALEISPGTVGATLNQAHAALRQRLEEVSA